MAFKSYRKQSRNIDWGSEEAEDSLTLKQINCGCLLRIADATELMAKNHQQLIDERDRYKRFYENEKRYANKLYHRIAGLRGYITQIKGR